MDSLIIGNGEIGSALHKILGGDVVDKDGMGAKEYDIIHICFPYFNGFDDEVRKYQDWYKPRHTVIHSTVPIGTSRKCGAIHSPVSGIHPFLEEGLRTFPKYLGGEKASEVADYFRRKGFKVYITDKPETTELTKILCTTYYAMSIEYTKDVKEQCEKYGVPFEFWTVWNENYNKGYEKLGFPEYMRQNLVPIMTKQGGHCTLPNCELLETKFTKFIKEQN